MKEKLQKILQVKEELNLTLVACGLESQQKFENIPSQVRRIQPREVSSAKTEQYGFFVVDTQGWIGTFVNSSSERTAVIVPQADFSELGYGKVIFDESYSIQVSSDTVEILNNEISNVPIHTDFNFLSTTFECSEGIQCELYRKSTRDGFLKISGTRGGTVTILLNDSHNTSKTLTVTRYELEGIIRQGWISTKPMSSSDLFYIDTGEIYDPRKEMRVVFSSVQTSGATSFQIFGNIESNNGYRISCQQPLVNSDHTTHVTSIVSGAPNYRQEVVLAPIGYTGIIEYIQRPVEGIPSVVSSEEGTVSIENLDTGFTRTTVLFGSRDAEGKVSNQSDNIKLYLYEYEGKKYIPVKRSGIASPGKDDIFLMCIATGETLTWSTGDSGGYYVSSGELTPETDFLNN